MIAAAAELLAAIARPSYTPARRDVPGLIALLVEADVEAEHGVALRRALARVEGPVVTAAVLAALPQADDAAGARLVPALVQAAITEATPVARAALIAALSDQRPRVRRAATTALGKVGGEDVAAALCARWDRDDLDPAERRAAAAALGKVGGDEARRRLAGAEAGDDA